MSAAAPAKMTPGGYLSRRRRAAGLEPADVDRAMTDRGVAGWYRGDWLAIEATLRRVTMDLAASLEGIFPFDPIVLRRISEGAETRVCDACGCSEMDPCQGADGMPCHWISRDLCSDCNNRGVPLP
jgi:hypothetical protein